VDTSNSRVDENKDVNGRPALRKLWRCLFFALALGLLFWLLDRIGWSTIGDALAQVGWAGALALLILGLAENFFDAAAMHSAARGRIGLFRILSYNSAGAIVNVLIPWEAGEVLKGTLLKRHVSVNEAISATILWNYLFKVTRPAIAFAAALTGIALASGVDAWLAAVILVVTLLAFLPYFGVMVLIGKGMASIFVRLLRLLRLGGRDPDTLLAAARNLDRELQMFRRDSPRRYFLILLYQSLARVTSWLTIVAAVRLLGLDYSFALCSMIYAGISVSNYILVLFPARVGLGEGAGYLLFSLYGLDGGMGLILTLVMRIKGLITNGVAGALALVGREHRFTSRRTTERKR